MWRRLPESLQVPSWWQDAGEIVHLSSHTAPCALEPPLGGISGDRKGLFLPTRFHEDPEKR